MHVGLFGEDLPDRIRTLHEKLQEMSRASHCRTMRTVLTSTTMIFCVLPFRNGSIAAEDFKKLSDPQIRRAFAAMEFTDPVH
jgi:hypothetical protein